MLFTKIVDAHGNNFIMDSLFITNIEIDKIHNLNMLNRLLKNRLN